MSLTSHLVGAKGEHGAEYFRMKPQNGAFLPWVSALCKPQSEGPKQRRGLEGSGGCIRVLLRGGLSTCLPRLKPGSCPVQDRWGCWAATAGGAEGRRDESELGSPPLAAGEHLVSMWHLAAVFATLAFPLVKGRAERFAPRRLICSAARQQPPPAPALWPGAAAQTPNQEPLHSGICTLP